MTQQTGVLYVATQQQRYAQEAAASAHRLKKLCPNLHATLFTDLPPAATQNYNCFDHVQPIAPNPATDPDWGQGLLDRLRCLAQSPYERTLHLDSDTAVLTNQVASLFDLLDDADVAMAECAPDASVSRHIYARPMFNAGVILYKQSPKVAQLFTQWIDLTARHLQLAADPADPNPEYLAHVPDPQARRQLLRNDQIALVQLLSPQNNPLKLNVKTLHESWNFRGTRNNRQLDQPIKIDHRRVPRRLLEPADQALQARRIEHALQAFRQLAAQFPNDAYVYYQLGNCLAAADKPRMATQALQRAIDFNPYDPRPYQALASLLYDHDQTDQAVLTLQALLKIEPNAPDALVNLAKLTREAGDLPSSIEYGRRAVQEHPTHAMGHINLVTSYLVQGEHAAAAEQCDRCLTVAANPTNILSLKTIALGQLKRWDQYEYYTDRQRYVARRNLTPPDGFENLDQFNQDLCRRVLAHPTLRRSPKKHATRNGWHTGELAAETTPLARRTHTRHRRKRTPIHERTPRRRPQPPIHRRKTKKLPRLHVVRRHGAARPPGSTRPRLRMAQRRLLRTGPRRHETRRRRRRPPRLPRPTRLARLRPAPARKIPLRLHTTKRHMGQTPRRTHRPLPLILLAQHHPIRLRPTENLPRIRYHPPMTDLKPTDTEELPPDAPQTPAEAQEEKPFRFTYSDGLPDALQRLDVTLWVSTYQAGKLAVFRVNDGRLSMLPRTFDKAMGFALDHRRLAIGTRYQIWQLPNETILAPRIEPKGEHDACYVPRTSHVTGYIDIHELAFAGDELWIVNTHFSCLCTLDPRYSFVPRWRPPFVTEIRRNDRCHLNGLAVVDAQPKYVTAFAETDTKEGWRQHKRDGGCVIDVTNNHILARGFSMPHSPRVADNKLWLLDSGNGRLVTVDVKDGSTNVVAEFPGYTRGLAIHGPYAFVGLSKVREKSVFGGIRLEETVPEPKCGVWVVDTRTGQHVGFIEFEKTIDEVFDVQLLPRIRRPAVIGFNKETIQRACVIAPEDPWPPNPAP